MTCTVELFEFTLQICHFNDAKFNCYISCYVKVEKISL